MLASVVLNKYLWSDVLSLRFSSIHGPLGGECTMSLRAWGHRRMKKMMAHVIENDYEVYILFHNILVFVLYTKYLKLFNFE